MKKPFKETNRKSYSVYQRVWIDFNGCDIPKGYHIHHLDGNRKNNNPENLICVSPKIHYEIHLALWERYGRRKDLAAAVFLKKEIENPKKLPSPNKGVKMTEESRLKISNSKKGKSSWNKGLKMSEESKINMSNAHIGKSWSESHRLNFVKSRKGGKTNKAKPFYYDGILYRTTREFSTKTGKSRTYIVDRLNNDKNKTAYYV
jgi:hypothetical protein